MLQPTKAGGHLPQDTQQQQQQQKQQQHNVTGAGACAGPAGPQDGAGLAGSWPLTMKIAVLQARNIRGGKGEHVNSFVRVQFADFDPNDSPVTMDSSNPEYGFVTEQELNVDEALIDTVANRKLCLTLIEQLPKEKTAILGTAEICLGPYFVKLPPLNENGEVVGLADKAQRANKTDGRAEAFHHGAAIESKKADDVAERQAGKEDTQRDPEDSVVQTSLRTWIPITYLNPKLLPSSGSSGRNTAAPPDETSAAGAAGGAAGLPGAGSGVPSTAPEFEIEVKLSEPLLKPDQLASGNIVVIHLEDCWPLPEEWSTKEGNEKDPNSNVYSYSMHFAVPRNATADRIVTVPNGKLVAADEGPPGPPTANAGEGGPAPGAAETKDTQTASRHKRITWTQPLLVWLSPTAVQRFKGKVMAKEKIEFEFTRHVQQRFAQTILDTSGNKYRGRGQIDCSPLLFPRSTVLKGRFALESASPAVSGSVVALVTASATTGGTPPSVLSSGNQLSYTTLGTTLGLEIIFERPLVEKKKLEPVTKKVADIIPRKQIPAHVLYEKRSAKAVDLYKKEIRTVAHQLLQQYRLMLEDESANIAVTKDGGSPQNAVGGMAGVAEEANPSGGEQIKRENPGTRQAKEAQRRKKLFIFRLNRSGMYFNFKETLKGSVIEVVRETFKRKSAFATREEMQTFMSEIYVFLVEAMHSAINELFTVKHPDEELTEPMRQVELLRSLLQFANEAERDGDVVRASKYHLERVASHSEDHPYVWYDYGAFCMRNGMQGKGQECFKEILSRGLKHVPTLLAYGALCTLGEKYEEARVMFHTALEVQPINCLCPSIMALYWDFVGEEQERDRFMGNANRLWLAQNCSPSTESGPKVAPTSLHLETAKFLISVNAGQLAEKALAHELLENSSKTLSTGGPSDDKRKILPYLLLSRMELQRGNIEEATQHVKQALEIRQDDPNAWAVFGHIHFVQREFVEAMSAYETVVSLEQESDDPSVLFSRLGFLHLKFAFSYVPCEKGVFSEKIDKDKANAAKGMYIRACEIAPTSRSWLGVGRASLTLEEWSDAEDALSEANVLNNRDPDIWGCLALLSTKVGRKFEAHQAIRQALRTGIKDAEILNQVGRAFLEANDRLAAVECLRMAMEIEPKNPRFEGDFLHALNQGEKTNAGPLVCRDTKE